MRILIIIVSLFALVGCESLGTIIKEKKYTISIHETARIKHGFGYYQKPDNYVGYGVKGTFGSKNIRPAHMHTPWCPHAKKVGDTE